jgi:hypothetical protein
LPWPLRIAANLAVVFMCAVAVVHVVFVFFHVAPINSISQRYEEEINGWIFPLFEQDWRLFAPNPESRNTQIWARTAQSSGDEIVQQSDWFDLTAVDNEAVKHNVFPSHTTQNMLRRAWNSYVDAHGSDDQPRSSRAYMMQQYVRDIAVDRITSHRPGTFDAIQLRVEAHPIPLSGARSAGSDAVETRSLPWWEVTPDEH